MKYEAIIYRNDGTKLTIKADDQEKAIQIAKNYHCKYGYDTAVTETRVIFYRNTEQGGE